MSNGVIIYSKMVNCAMAVLLYMKRVNDMSGLKIDSMSSSRTMPSLGQNNAGQINAADSDFASQLSDQQGSLTREQLMQLLKQIDEQGARLTKTPTFDELRSYRELVKEFVSEAVANMYELRTQSGWDRMGRQKVYTTVKNIDDELEKMAEKIRLGQTDQLDVVASHDAIRGMLVDIFM